MSLQTTFSILYVVSNLTVATLFASLKVLRSFLPGILVGQSFHTFLCQYLTQPDRGGGSNCELCKGDCHGHYLKPAESLQSTSPQMVSPPSVILKGVFQSLQHYPATEAEIEEIDKQALLTRQETEMWFEHLHTIRENRKRGFHMQLLQGVKGRSKKRRKRKSLHTTVLHVPLLTKSSVTQWKTGLDASCVTLCTILLVLEVIILAFPTNFFVISVDELSVCIVYYSMCSCFYGTLLVYSQIKLCYTCTCTVSSS